MKIHVLLITTGQTVVPFFLFLVKLPLYLEQEVKFVI